MKPGLTSLMRYVESNADSTFQNRSKTPPHRLERAFVDRKRTQMATMATATIVKSWTAGSAKSKRPSSSPGWSTYHLRLPSTLHQRPSLSILPDGLQIIPQTIHQAPQTQKPEQKADRQRDPFLDAGGLTFQVEGKDDGGADDGHVDAKTEPGEKSTLIGAMIAGIGRLIWEEERGEDRLLVERVLARGAGIDQYLGDEVCAEARKVAYRSMSTDRDPQGSKMNAMRFDNVLVQHHGGFRLRRTCRVQACNVRSGELWRGEHWWVGRSHGAFWQASAPRPAPEKSRGSRPQQLLL